MTMIRISAVLIAVALLAGCSTNVSRFEMPGADLAGIEALYLNELQEKRNAEEILSLVRSDLEARGYRVGENSDAVQFGDQDYVFDITADWHWDITWYLLELRVAIYDPQDNTLIAQAQSQQTSLARQSTDVVVERVMASLFNDEAVETEEAPQ
ncbi:MAG: hypothetical protein AAGA33_08900 [Pseudomonadota bacterium]